MQSLDFQSIKGGRRGTQLISRFKGVKTTNYKESIPSSFQKVGVPTKNTGSFLAPT